MQARTRNIIATPQYRAALERREEQPNPLSFSTLLLAP